MNKSLLELLNNVTLLHFTCAIVLIVILAGIISSQKNKIFKRLNKWRKTKNDEEDFKSLVYNLRDSVKEINNSIEQIEKDRIKSCESINNLTNMFIDKEINDMRWEINNFATKVSEEKPCNKDSYKHCIHTYEKYEKLLKENGLENGEVEISMEIINESYKQKLKEGF